MTKIKLNSEWPIKNNPYSRMYDPTLAEAITATARELLGTVIADDFTRLIWGTIMLKDMKPLKLTKGDRPRGYDYRQHDKREKKPR